MKKISILMTLISLGFSLQAQDTLAVKDLKQVVVTGQYSPQTVKNSVYQVKVIGRDRIEQQSASKLQDILSTEINMRFSQDVATGGTNISMMGLKGQNVKILLDGLPLIGRQGINNEIGINQIDINSIERIEVVEGPMSVIYGADALAGVINIITRKAPKATWSGSIKLHEETAGKEYGISKGIHNPSALLMYNKGKWELGGNISYNYFGGWKDTAIGRELVWNKRDQILGGGYVLYRGNQWSVKLRSEGLDELIQDPGNFIYPNLAAGDTLAINKKYFSNRSTNQLHANWYINGKANLQTQVSYSLYNRQVFSTTLSKRTGAERLDLTPEAQSQVHFTGLTARATLAYLINQHVSIQPGIDINTETGEGERMKNGVNKIQDYALFATADIKTNKGLNLRPGIRVIKNSVYKAPPVVPSLNVKYRLNEQMDIRFSYAHGFRAPSVRELYFNFFDINHQIIGNPDLKAETSNSFNLSWNYEKAKPGKLAYSTTASLFFNRIKNMIDYAVSSWSSDVYTMSNIYTSKTAGAAINSMVKYRQWNLNTGIGYTGYFNEFSAVSDSLPVMQWSPEVTLNAGYRFEKTGIDANLYVKYTGKMPGYFQNGNQYVPLKTQDYTLADFSLSKKFKSNFVFNAGVRNIFDVKRLKNTSTIASVHSNNNIKSIGTGRSYFFGLQYSFTKK